jgi:hypothetical protein
MLTETPKKCPSDHKEIKSAMAMLANNFGENV